MSVEFSKNLRALRLEKNLTVKGLARCAGVSFQTLYKYESGEIRNPSVSLVERIARALGVNPSELVGGEWTRS